MRTIRIGSGAGYGGDRIDPAIDLIEQGDLDYIGFECLAERTIALAVRQRAADQDLGYNELLEERFRKILPAMSGRRVKVITNMGAANPAAAARKVAEIARSLGVDGLKIAAVTGDDLTDQLQDFMDLPVIESGQLLRNTAGKVISANAYCGVAGILDALRRGANIVITGRVSDPALFLAPVIHEFGWELNDWQRLGQGTVMGHLLECAAQVTGGYYADPGFKDVPDLWRVGFPISEIREDGQLMISKLPSAGGMVTFGTVSEQLLYEILDPAAYLTPDVVADFSRIHIYETGPDRVEVVNGSGHPKTGLLKVSIGLDEGYISEGEISYGGPGSLERARLAGEIIQKRIEYLKIPVNELRIDYLGVNSLYGNQLSRRLESYQETTPEVRLRVAARSTSHAAATLIGREVEALYLNGPAGGGGARQYVRPVIGVVSVLVPENLVRLQVDILEV